METALWTQGLRRKLELGKRRHEFQANHGLRKFFDTTLANCGVNPLIKELLMGHSVGLDNSYYRPSESTMLTEYAKAINALTIDDAYKWKQKYEQSQIDNEVLQRQEAEIKALRQRLETKVKSFEEAVASFPTIKKQKKKQKIDILRIKRKDLERSKK